MFDTTPNRRDVLAGVGSLGAVTVAGCSGGNGNGGNGNGGGNGTAEIATARLSSGATSLVAPLIASEGFDEEYGFDLEVLVRDSISSYYGDFVSGTYSALPFGPSAAASRANGGVNLSIVSGFTYSSMWWVTNDSGIQSIEDIEGETVAVPLGSGSFAVADAVVREQTGQSVEELAGETINAPGPGGSPPEVLTGNASVGLSWEPALSTFLLQDNDLEAIVDVRSRYRELFGSESFHLVWAVRDDLIESSPDAVSGLFEASQDVADLYAEDLEGTIETLIGETENEPGPVREAIDSGRLEFAMDQIGRASCRERVYSGV
jgi:ABC-type nitrate/sulfonate/bicarbonate transport system substrate-binding protein